MVSRMRDYPADLIAHKSQQDAAPTIYIAQLSMNSMLIIKGSGSGFQPR
jgi:hypothetical protein